MSLKNESKYLLALHSSSGKLGVGMLDLTDMNQTIHTSLFETGKELSNNLFNCVQEVLPYKSWKKIVRVAVATGPGGFTGTRLTISMARTISQQLKCPLDGTSSFALMAHRLAKKHNLTEKNNLFWVTQFARRRGIIAGQYKIIRSNQEGLKIEIMELKKPHLTTNTFFNEPTFSADEDVQQDIIKLIETSNTYHQNNTKSSWSNILPIYPTSPVE